MELWEDRCMLFTTAHQCCTESQTLLMFLCGIIYMIPMWPMFSQTFHWMALIVLDLLFFLSTSIACTEFTDCFSQHVDLQLLGNCFFSKLPSKELLVGGFVQRHFDMGSYLDTLSTFKIRLKTFGWTLFLKLFASSVQLLALTTWAVFRLSTFYSL